MSNIVGICLTSLISYCNNNMRNVSVRGTQIRAISMHSYIRWNPFTGEYLLMALKG